MQNMLSFLTGHAQDRLSFDLWSRGSIWRGAGNCLHLPVQRQAQSFCSQSHLGLDSYGRAYLAAYGVAWTPTPMTQRA